MAKIFRAVVDILRRLSSNRHQVCRRSRDRKKSQVDYREVLNEADFIAFSELRELRKQVALRENVAVYVVFTNEQLAEMVQQRVACKADLEKIAGARSARVAKFGDPFLDLP